MIYTYPALFHKEEGDTYSVTFYDLPSGITSADDREEALDIAYDNLSMMLLDEEYFPKKLIKKPTPIENIDVEKAFISIFGSYTEGSFILNISFDEDEM